MPGELTPEERERIVRMWARGVRLAEIVRRIGCMRDTVRAVVPRADWTAHAGHCAGAGWAQVGAVYPHSGAGGREEGAAFGNHKPAEALLETGGRAGRPGGAIGSHQGHVASTGIVSKRRKGPMARQTQAHSPAPGRDAWIAFWIATDSGRGRIQPYATLQPSLIFLRQPTSTHAVDSRRWDS